MTAVAGLPWAVGYEIAAEELFVIAVFHQRRKSAYWTGRAGC